MLICLLGPTCAGKDTILNEIFDGSRSVELEIAPPNQKIRLERLPIYTTRPRRSNEYVGTYYFLDHPYCSSPKNIKFILNGHLVKWADNPPIETRQYHTIEGVWEYGTLSPVLKLNNGEKINLYDITKNDYIVACSISQLNAYLKVFETKHIAVIYLPIGLKEQYKRYFNRVIEKDNFCSSDMKEMIRRIDEDAKDYSNIVSWLGNHFGINSFTSMPNATSSDIIEEIFHIVNKQ